MLSFLWSQIGYFQSQNLEECVPTTHNESSTYTIPGLTLSRQLELK